MSVQCFVRVAKHLRKFLIAADNYAIFGIDQPNRGMFEDESFEMFVHKDLRVFTDHVMSRVSLACNLSDGGASGRKDCWLGPH